MTQFRSEQRAFLAWCLDRELFTAKEAMERFGGQKSEMHLRLRKLEDKGFIYRVANENAHRFGLVDKDATRRAVNEQPLPKNGYVKVADRPKPQQTRFINSVWQLGAQ